MQYVLPFIVGMVVTMVGLPVLARLANKWLIVDHPGDRKVHLIPIPRIGGLAMAAGVFVAAFLTMQLNSQDLWFMVAACVLIIFGALDDRFDLDYRVKLLAQLAAVSVVVLAGGVRVQTITLDDRFWLPEWLSLPLTIFFLVGVTNAVNLADGLDGLAGGTTFLCLCAVALLSSVANSGASTALCLAFAGAVLGFLRFNTYPASVFMGDAGSQLLGFAIGVLSIRATQNISSEFSATLPVLLLALPILDTLSVMAQRVGEGRSPFSADKNHIHHKLLALGFDHHEAVMVIYVIQGLLFVGAYVLRFESDVLILGVVSAFFLVCITIFQAASRSGWRFRQPREIQTPTSSPLLATILRQPEVLPRFAYATAGIAVGSYALLIVVEAASLRNDFKLLIISLLAVIVGLSALLRRAPLSLVEKAVLYVTATVLVYLDAVVFPASGVMSTLGWVALSITALATLLRLRLHSDRSFQVTPLDLIVLFMALVVPSLPGTFDLPHGGSLAIAKLVVLFYALEMLLSKSDRKAVWVRLAAACILAGLILRPLLPV